MMIRKATENDIEEISKIYDTARKYMKSNGNPSQWDNGYPDKDVIRNDISGGNSYLVESEKDILGVFVFIIGEESTYRVIEQGKWSSHKKYGTIHRIASSGKIKGFTKVCFDFCSEKIDYLRIDTHRDNKSMQAAVEKYGFKKCRIIYVRNSERIAYDYVHKTLKQE